MILVSDPTAAEEQRLAEGRWPNSDLSNGSCIRNRCAQTWGRGHSTAGPRQEREVA